MFWESVESSVISSIAYDEGFQTLHIVFNSGSEYIYYDVRQEVYDDFLRASSKGTFFNAEIKGNYSYARG